MTINAEQILNAVETCIKERKPYGVKNWVICWLNDGLRCMPKDTVKNDGNIFGHITEDDATHGLTLKQWGEIQYKISWFFEQKK